MGQNRMGDDRKRWCWIEWDKMKRLEAGRDWIWVVVTIMIIIILITPTMIIINVTTRKK